MKYKKVILVSITVIVCLFIFSLPTASSSALYAEPKPSSGDTQVLEDQIEQAVIDAIAASKNYVQSGLASDLQVTDIKISQDEQWATAWVVYYDPQTQSVVPIEPGLAITHLTNGQWTVLLPSDAGWQEALKSLPDDLMSADEKDMWLAMDQGTVEAYPTQSGYFLPWHGGQTGYLSRSVGHDADFDTAHYAFDFYYPGTQVCPAGGGNSESFWYGRL